MVLEVLHGTLVLGGRVAGLEGAEVPALPGLGVLLARVEAVFAALELTDHGVSSSAGELSEMTPPLRKSCKLRALTSGQSMGPGGSGWVDRRRGQQEGMVFFGT